MRRSPEFKPDVPFDLKVRLRDERREEDDIPVGVVIEIDHTLPRHLGGTNDEENLEAITRSEHLFKHLTGAIFPEPEQNVDAEWWSARQIVSRMNLDEFVDFMADFKPNIDPAVEALKESSLILRRRD